MEFTLHTSNTQGRCSNGNHQLTNLLLTHELRVPIKVVDTPIGAVDVGRHPIPCTVVADEVDDGGSGDVVVVADVPAAVVERQHAVALVEKIGVGVACIPRASAVIDVSLACP